MTISPDAARKAARKRPPLPIPSAEYWLRHARASNYVTADRFLYYENAVNHLEGALVCAIAQNIGDALHHWGAPTKLKEQKAAHAKLLRDEADAADEKFKQAERLCVENSQFPISDKMLSISLRRLADKIEGGE